MKELSIQFMAFTSRVSKKECQEIWGLGVDLKNETIDYDIIFELHSLEEVEGKYPNSQSRIEEILKFKGKKITAFEHPKMKNYELYPFGEIIKKYGRYLANSLVLMLLYAYEKGYKIINIYGCDFIHGSDREKELEAKCVEYWIGYLRAKGIEINTNDNEMCACDYVYGYEDKEMQLEIVRLNRRKEYLKKIYDYTEEKAVNNREKRLLSVSSRIAEIEYLISRT